MSQLINRIIFICLFVFVLGQVKAQQYYFEQFTTEDGLISSQVRAIHQDDFGYLWIGTATGLSKFDGTTFQNYTSSEFLVDPQVNAIFNRKRGGVWVVSTKGITAFNQNEITTHDLTSLIDDGNIYDAAEDSKGNIWCVVYKKGLLKIPFDENEEISFTSSSYRYTSIYINKKDEIYLNGEQGYIKKLDLSLKLNTAILIPDSLEVSRQITMLSEDTLVATSAASAFFIVNDKAHKFYFENHIAGARSIFVDSEKNIWISSKSGLRKISPNGEMIRFSTANGMPFESTRTVFEDRDKNIWIGTEGAGLLKFYPKQEFVSYTKNDGLPSEQVMSIIEDHSTMWFSTFSDGIFSSTNGEYTSITSNNGLPNNTVWSSAKTKDGTLWFATKDGLAGLKNEHIITYTTHDGLPSNRITALFVDVDERLWLGWKYGVAIFDNDTVVSFDKSEGFEGYRVRTIKQDKEKTLWVGCKNGLFAIKNGRAEEVFKADSLARNAQIYSIDIYRDHIIIGASSGLYFYNKATSKITQAVIFGEKIIHPAYFLTKEKSNTLWMGSSNGVWRYTLKEDKGNIVIESETQYGKKNGISNLETNQNSAFIDKNGQLWFGTGQGLVTRSSEKLSDSVTRNKLQVQISNIRLFLEEVEQKDSLISQPSGLPQNLKLKYNQNHITFDYKSIYLENPEQIRYQFKLVGFDNTWLPATKENTFTYSNLSHGEYVFEVRSSIDGNHWGDSAKYPFVITPPFWLTNWFLILSGVLLCSLIYLIYLWRTKINNRKRETERLEYKNKLLSLEQQSLSSSMNRHFIFNALNSIQYYINTQDRLSANKYLSSFAKLIRKNLESSGSKDNLIPLREELDRVELYLELENMRFQNKISYAVQVEPGLNIDEVKLPPMFFQPFIENSIWHGILPKDGGRVDVLIANPKPKQIKISIIDDGIGVETSQRNKNTTSHNSRGVYLTKRRIQLLEKTLNKKIEVLGPIEITNTQKHVLGTKVEILLPVDNLK